MPGARLQQTSLLSHRKLWYLSADILTFISLPTECLWLFIVPFPDDFVFYHFVLFPPIFWQDIYSRYIILTIAFIIHYFDPSVYLF